MGNKASSPATSSLEAAAAEAAAVARVHEFHFLALSATPREKEAERDHVFGQFFSDSRNKFVLAVTTPPSYGRDWGRLKERPLDVSFKLFGLRRNSFKVVEWELESHQLSDNPADYIMDAYLIVLDFRRLHYAGGENPFHDAQNSELTKLKAFAQLRSNRRLPPWHLMIMVVECDALESSRIKRNALYTYLNRLAVEYPGFIHNVIELGALRAERRNNFALQNTVLSCFATAAPQWITIDDDVWTLEQQLGQPLFDLRQVAVARVPSPVPQQQAAAAARAPSPVAQQQVAAARASSPVPQPQAFLPHTREGRAELLANAAMRRQTTGSPSPAASPSPPPIPKDKQCTVCTVAAKTHIIMPCRHYCLCADCVAELNSMEIKKCPICRGGITGFMQIYDS